jgi:dTDP-4-dehydrorhamnose 3,5-epimerase-like enzyme
MSEQTQVRPKPLVEIGGRPIIWNIYDSELLYMIDVSCVADAARCMRWNDPLTDVKWPDPVEVIADRDKSFPDWRP